MTPQDLLPRTSGEAVKIIKRAEKLEYHVTHAMILGAQNALYILAYDITKPHQLRELRRWLAFVKAGHDYSYQTKPDVVLVATHLDQMTSRADGEGRAESILQQMKSEFTNHLNILSDVIAINSLRYGSEAMNRLRDVLDNLAKGIKGSRTTPLLCEKIMQQQNDWHEQGSYPIISWAKFGSKVKAIYGLADDTLLQTAADVLTDMSEMTDFGNFVTSFNGVANDGVNHRYWSILIGQDRESAMTGPDGIIPDDGVDYIFYYRAY